MTSHIPFLNVSSPSIDSQLLSACLPNIYLTDLQQGSRADLDPLLTYMQDPTGVLDEYGADALRLYLINSPVVRGETLRFKKEGVFAVVKDVFLPWYNAYRFLVQNVLRLQQQTGVAFEPTKVALPSPKVLCRMQLHLLQTMTMVLQNVLP